MSDNDLDLLGQLARLEWLLHRFHQQNHRCRGPMGDVRRGQGRILALLKLKPEISQKELSGILDMRSQSLGELLVKLEKNGYITRTPSESDRRIMNISLTEAGKAASENTVQEPAEEELFGCLNEEERAALSDYLDRILLALEQQFGDGEAEHDFRHGHPRFGGMGFDPHHGMEDGHPRCGRRDFHGYPPHMGRPRPPFDDRGFDRRRDEDHDREDYNEE